MIAGETLNSSYPCSLLDSCKNNSNGETETGERISEIIENYNIQYVSAKDINHKWLARDKVKIAQWYLENLALNLGERDSLREDIEEALKTEYSEEVFSIKHKSETLQQSFRQIELYKRIKKVLEEVEFEKIDLIDYAKREFDKYVKDTHNRYRVMRDVENKLFLGKLQHRFSPSYTNKVKASLNPLLSDKRYQNKGVFLTLTLDPKRYNTRYDMYRDIKKEENRFLTLLFKKIGKRIPYISVIEAQNNGNPHLHMLFLGASRLLDWREIRNAWGLGYVWINRTTKDKKINSPLAYMYKYITKTIDKRNAENRTTQALLWLFHLRSYSTSNNLVKPLNSVTTGDIELLGLMHVNGFPLLTIQSNLREIIDYLTKKDIEEEETPPDVTDSIKKIEITPEILENEIKIEEKMSWRELN